MKNDTAKIKLSDDSSDVYFDEGMTSRSLSKNASQCLRDTMVKVENMLLSDIAGLTLNDKNDDADITLKTAIAHVLNMRKTLIDGDSYYTDNIKNYDLLLANLASYYHGLLVAFIYAHIELGNIDIDAPDVHESNEKFGSIVQRNLTRLREEQAKKAQIVQPQFPQNDAENVQFDDPFLDDDCDFGDAFAEPDFDAEFKAFEEAEKAQNAQKKSASKKHK